MSAFCPLALLVLSPLSPYQLYGVHIAFLLYHSADECTSFDSARNIVKAHIRSCSVHKSLLRSHFQQVPCAFLPPVSPLSPSPSATPGPHIDDFAPSSNWLHQNETLQRCSSDSLLCRRSRMPSNRVAVLSARGLNVPSNSASGAYTQLGEWQPSHAV